MKSDKLNLDCLEHELKSKVRGLALQLQWRYYHTNDSRRSEAGFPDLVLVRDGRLIFAELKRQKGVLSDDQIDWLNDLADCKGAECYVLRPSHWNDSTILNILTHPQTIPKVRQ